MHLLVKHSEIPAVAFDSFFFDRLVRGEDVDGYYNRKRPLEKDYVLIPVCSKSHWSVMVG